MTDKDKAFKLIMRIRDICNDGQTISFTRDRGGPACQNTMTVYIGDQHFHLGRAGDSDSDLIDNLFTSLEWPLYREEG